MDLVLEHLPNPRAAVEVIHHLLKAGGVAYVLVPNEDRLAYVASEVLLRVKKRHGEIPKLAPLCNPFHIVGFNKTSFCRLFKDSGFRNKYLRIFRGVESWKKSEASLIGVNLKGRIFQLVEGLFYDMGKLLGRGTMIEAIWEKVSESFDSLR